MTAGRHSLSKNPLLDESSARQVLRDHWWLEGRLSDLGSLQDQNLRVTTADGTRYVLKIVPDDVDIDHVELQNAAMQHVAERAAGFRSPVCVPSALDGRWIVPVDGLYCRVLTWVDGRPFAESTWIDRAGLVELGALVAQVATALAGFEHAELDRALVWDPRRSRTVVDELLPDIADAGLRHAIVDSLSSFDRLADLDGLPLTPVHGDVTPTNVVCDPSIGMTARLTGVVDFGDVMRTWRVGDLAATVIGSIEHAGVDDALEAALAVLTGYHAVNPLEIEEADSFWTLVQARAAVNAAISQVQAEMNPANWYAQDGVGSSLRALAAVSAVPVSLAVAGARAVVGAPSRILATGRARADLVDGVAGAPILDLSVDTDAFDLGALDSGAGDSPAVDSGVVGGGWWDPAILQRLVRHRSPAIASWGEFRLLGAGELHSEPPSNLHLGADVFTAARSPVHAPLDAVVHGTSGQELILAAPDNEGRPLFVRLSGIVPDPTVAPGTAVAAGAVVGAVAEPDEPTATPRVHVQLMVAPDLPKLGTARHRDAWLAACPDPSGLLGLDVAAPARTRPEEQRRRRVEVVGASQHLYYERPIEIVRGYRHFLYDSDGRAYLDMINNIATVGHSHPRVTAAAIRQLRRLNTNSRFLYDSMTRYSERMSQLLPPELDSVFLVNSGSEAADLALQLARAFTGRRDIAAVEGAYHGWTGAVLDISTSPNDRPNWRSELRPGVHIVDQPNPYRGAHGADAGAYDRSVQQACEAAGAREGLAAFVVEPLLGNQGAVEPVPGFVRRAFEAVRAAGGVCIADEVQVGMARTGDFWAFEHEDAAPDILYTAKATGAGHPLGVVVCRRDIAEAFDQRAAFFASTGGGPVSCEIGLAVLDIIRDEGLQANARTVGSHLRTRLIGLSERHSLIGAVHGRGLYLGVELVRDRATKEPAVEEAAAISERLLALGVIMQPTGDSLNVLKVKPPLCLDEAAADFFVDALERTLHELAGGST